jgi:hypothetical protein
VKELIDFGGRVLTLFAVVVLASKMLTWALDYDLRMFKAYGLFAQYIWHQKEFKQWRKNK